MTREELKIIARTPYLVRMIEEMHARIQMNDKRGTDGIETDILERVLEETSNRLDELNDIVIDVMFAYDTARERFIKHPSEKHTANLELCRARLYAMKDVAAALGVDINYVWDDTNRYFRELHGFTIRQDL